MKHCLSLFILAFFCRHAADAQLTGYEEKKEKVYVHTSHVYYKPGETVYFKVYVVKGSNHRPSALSGIVDVDIISPSGNVLQQLKFPVKDGYAEGSHDFSTSDPGGIYRLRASTAWMRNEDESRWFTKEITLHRVVAPRVLMQLEFPGKGYGPGSEVTADFSMRSLEGKPVALHASEYTLNLNGKPAGKGSFSTDNNGRAKIKFRLPETLESSAGLLNITVKYDSYTESISRSIPIVLNKIDLQFMPEGGTLTEGLAGTMAFRAVNEFGKAADVKGVIVDSEGNTVAEFGSYHFGMGKFSFTPSRNKTYEARITSPKGITQRYPLPAATKDGLVMQVNRGPGKLSVILRSTHRQRVRIAGFSRNNLLLEKMIDLHPGRAAEFPVDTTLFPAGIARFTVFNAAGLPAAERVVFLQMDKTLRVSLTPDKPVYLPREKVTLKIKTENKNKLPVPANLSLSVVDDKLWTFADDKQHHILSWLLMGSELQGKVEEPDFYFREDEPKAFPALDLVMLTHGYRYFEYIPEVEKENRLRFLPEQANVLNGTVLNAAEKPVKSDVYLLSSRNWGRNDKMLYMETAADGRFYFSGLEPDEAYFVIARSRKKNEMVHVTITSKGFGSVLPANPLPVNETSLSADTIASTGTPLPTGVPETGKKVETFSSLPELLSKDEKHLEEVVVVAMGTSKTVRNLGASANVIREFELGVQTGAAQQLVGRINGVQVVEQANPGIGGRVMIRGTSTLSGNNEPLIVIDGVPVSAGNIRMDPNDIANITVLKDAQASAIYGCHAANGVILIQSKRWIQKNIHLRFYKTGEYFTQRLQPFRMEYAVARKFYSPVYASTKVSVREDFRETIYWNPVVQTNKAGEATVSFYNSDAATTFRAIAEGIGYDGAPGRAELTYSTQQTLAVDAKMPPEFTVGDKVLMPLHLKNNGDVPMSLQISVTAPSGLRAESIGRRSFTLNAGESELVSVEVEALRTCKETLLVTASANGVEERLEVPVEAVDRGFPIHRVFAGKKTADHHFTVSKAIPGTLRYNLHLFAGLEDQLLDGIKTLLREPHGCFEQTSATTWPNVLVLRLLKQSGKNNPEAEEQAMAYIRQGYNRLLAFETKEDGFEWFGDTPPHLGLTAMGLMEFTDMKEFVQVDDGMLDRTKKWLLGRRDGKGGFKASKNGMGQFYGVSPAVSNCYVVYALTQAGIREEIRNEYAQAFKLAIESKDAYLIGLMAIAADNMKEEAGFRQLLDMLNEGKLKTNTTIVSSRYSSLEVEVAALHVLALAREKEPRFDKMTLLLEQIMKKKGNNGYGSTQGTVLALQAMSAYAFRYGEEAAGVSASFALNGKNIQPGIIRPEQAVETQQTFTSSFSNGKGGLYYSMEVDYSTFIPPNSADAELELHTQLQHNEVRTGETVRLDISLRNKRPAPQAMAVAKIGIPAGLSLQPWQLKQLSEENRIAYYELFDNYLVIYWTGLSPHETKKLSLDLKADIPGSFTGKASTAYLYYMPEHKHWNEGLKTIVKE